MITISNEKDIQLLHKYLTKHLIKTKNYDTDKAKQEANKLIKANKDNLFGYKGLAHWLGQYSFEFFNLYFLQDLLANGDDKAPLSPTHFSIWQELENAILLKDYDQRAYIFPRGFGKTTTLSIPYIIWCHVYEYKNYTVIASAVADTAEGFLASIRGILKENKHIKQAFGELIDTKKYKVNSELIQLTNRSAIQSISASGAIRGKQNELTNKRIELLIMDDYQTSDECKTEQQRDKKWKTFNADAKNAMQKDNYTIIGFGTVQHSQDFYSRLLQSPTWRTRIERGVLIDDLDEYFHSGLWEEFYKLLMNSKDTNALDTAKEFYLQNYEEMQYPVIWNYFDCLAYAISYYEDKETFMQEVQNDTSLTGMKKFKTIITESAEEIESHNFTKTMLCVDPAGQRNKLSNTDYFAFAVGSSSDSGIKYIRKGELHRFNYEDYISHTIKLLKDYEDITHLAIEKQTYSGADVLEISRKIAEDDKLRYRNIEIINYHQTKNKDDKINTIVGKVNLGQVVFNEQDQEFISQIQSFCGTKFSVHDDAADVTAECVIRLDDIEIVKYATAGDRRLLGL